MCENFNQRDYMLISRQFMSYSLTDLKYLHILLISLIKLENKKKMLVITNYECVVIEMNRCKPKWDHLTLCYCFWNSTKYISFSIQYNVVSRRKT